MFCECSVPELLEGGGCFGLRGPCHGETPTLWHWEGKPGGGGAGRRSVGERRRGRGGGGGRTSIGLLFAMRFYAKGKTFSPKQYLADTALKLRNFPTMLWYPLSPVGALRYIAVVPLCCWQALSPACLNERLRLPPLLSEGIRRAASNSYQRRKRPKHPSCEGPLQSQRHPLE